MCKFFDVSRSGYYDWTKRFSKAAKDRWLADLIAECQTKSNKTYGYRRVKIWLLREYGLIANHKAVLRVMNKYNMLSEIRRRRKYQQYFDAVHKYPNLLNQDFQAENPNQKWVTGISYIHTKQGVLYLSAIKDLYDGFIVAHNYGTEQSVNLVLNTINLAKKKEKVASGLTLHSDQGFQYTSHAYFHLTKEYDITTSMSRRANPFDNASMENFFGTLKSECVYRTKIDTIEQAKQLINEYIYFYNYERICLKTNQTPYEKRCLTA